MHDLLHDEKLERYYALAGDRVTPAAVPETTRTHAWLEPLVDQSAASPSEVCSLSLDVQGIHCAACVWLMNETFKRTSGAGDLIINPTLGTVELTYKRGQFEPQRWIDDVERYGYRFGPPRKEGSKKSIELPLRLGVSAAITINVMIFSVSFYMGLTPAESDIFRLFTWLSLGLTTLTVIVGGWPFLRSVRMGFSHLDLPIALGIVLVYAMSIIQLLTNGGRGDLTYFDTLNTFITLMLLGRFLQERMLERNRRFLLEDDGADGILVRRVRDERLETVPAPRVEAGDRLLVAPGEVVPVEAELLDPQATVSADWMTGESTPIALTLGATVRAGSFNAGTRAMRLLSRQAFVDSALVRLLRAPNPRSTQNQLWNRIAKWWVAGVLALSSLGFVLWLGEGLGKAIDVSAALLVITCPCAIGIAIPLAYELVQARLRRLGFYVRNGDLLDRLASVRQIVFDKTGTVTLGRLELATSLDGLSLGERSVAYNLAVRSSHPISTVLARALEAQGARFDPELQVTELAGHGVEVTLEGQRWRLGRGDWAQGQGGTGTLLTRDGALLARIETREVLRPDARKELHALEAQGFTVRILSGDAQARVDALAQTLGLARERAEGGLSPEGKAARLEALGGSRDTLYVGDGVNDALAFDAALAAGTPAVDRPVMPGKSDFFLVGEGLSPIERALSESRRLQRVVRRILALSLAYNALAVTLSLLGVMSPVSAAISMPSSTLSLLLFTAASLRDRPSPSPSLAAAPLTSAA